MIVFTSLDQIKSHPWVGAYHFDAEAMRAVDIFAADESRPLADRAEAIRDMADRALGVGRCEEISDAELVLRHFE